MLSVRLATTADATFIAQFDPHLPGVQLPSKLAAGEIYLAHNPHQPLGLLRYGLLWDLIPFMYLLIVNPAHRRQGVGTALVTGWEQAMQQAGHTQVLTSTLANEAAQHFYRRLGYLDLGGFVLPGEPLELVLGKTLPL